MMQSLECGGDLAMEPSPLARSQVIVQRLAQQRMRKTEGRWPRDADDSHRLRLAHQRGELLRGVPVDQRKQLVVRLLADHRSRRQDGTRVGRQKTEPAPDCASYAVGELESGKVDPGATAEPALGRERPEHAIDEERVPGGRAVQLGDDSNGGVARRAPGHQISHFTLCQSGERKQEGVANDLVHQRRALGRAAHLRLAVRADDQHIGVVEYPGGELQHLQRRRVGFVQVIEDDHDRLLARRFPEQRGDRVE
jgi:hypothetical protein